jgi:LuxR family maltose regulon positive regulatory protein
MTTPSPSAVPWLSAQVAITLAETFLDLRDLSAARFRAEEARGHLNALLTEGVLREHLLRVSASLARQGGHSPIPSAMALSKAEMRVLQLLPTHLSLAEIGEELYIARNTVKSQVAAVYLKLGCSTRTEAVAQARYLGLLQS